MSDIGLCPFCNEVVTGILVEENTIRRNIYKCPKCGKRILKCMTPFCSNFAEGGDFWDDNLCPECTDGLCSIVQHTATEFKNKYPDRTMRNKH